MKKKEFLVNNGYLHLFIKTKKWKEFHPKNKQVLIPILVGICLVVFTNSIKLNEIKINEILKNLSLYMISSFIGLLGFLISGISIITGTLNAKLVDIIEEYDFVDEIQGILYSFYFIGGFVLLNIVSYIFLYVLAYSENSINNSLIGLITFFMTFLSLFTLIFCLSLIGTCISMVSIVNKLTRLENIKKEKSALK